MDPWFLICEKTVPYIYELSHWWALWSQRLFLTLNICDVRTGGFHHLGQNICSHCTAGYSEVPGEWVHPVTPLQQVGHFSKAIDLMLLPRGVVSLTPHSLTKINVPVQITWWRESSKPDISQKYWARSTLGYSPIQEAQQIYVCPMARRVTFCRCLELGSL